MREKNILQGLLCKASKYILYLVATIIALIFTAVIFIHITYLHEKKEFINNCIKEGDSLEQCKNIWVEVDALN